MSETASETVLVMGASPKPQRYSFKAIQMLKEYGHRVLPVNPYHQEIAGQTCVADLDDLNQTVDTVTLYVRPELLAPHIDELKALKPRRIIFNPGTESEEFEAEFERAGIEVLEACTLVLLRSNQF